MLTTRSPLLACYCTQCTLFSLTDCECHTSHDWNNITTLHIKDAESAYIAHPDYGQISRSLNAGMSYWGLPHFQDVYSGVERQHILREYGYEIEMDEVTMQRLLLRSFLGLPRFEDLYNATEMHQQIKDQDIRTSVPADDMSYRSCAIVLSLAHQRRTFHRFLDLPPELRECVYEFTFSAPGLRGRVQQPAVSEPLASTFRRKDSAVFDHLSMQILEC